jgi:hypothetical protein
MAWKAQEGNSAIMLWYPAAAEDIVPARLDVKQWLEPLQRYFLPRPTPPQPLDYAFVALLQQGLSKIFARQKQRIVPLITRKVGKRWWHGEEPISIYKDTYSLQKLLAPIIQERLDEHKLNAPQVTSFSFKSSAELARLGVQIFTNELQKQGEIACQLDGNKASLTITITECPFCLGQSELCQVFLGVLEGLLEWYHRAYPRSTIDPAMKINEDVSTAHRIVLDSIPFKATSTPTPRLFLSASEELEAMRQRVITIEQERDQARQQCGHWEQQAMALQQSVREHEATIAQLIARVQELQQAANTTDS